MADFLMPSLGADMEEATLVQWLVKPGDAIARGQIIAEVDTAKGVIELECFETGVVAQLVAHQGETLPVGAVLAVINGTGKAAGHILPQAASAINQLNDPQPHQVQLPPPYDKLPETITTPSATPSAVSSARMRITPVARRRAVELDVDVSVISGTGVNGEITLYDVELAAKLPEPRPVEEPKREIKIDLAAEGRDRLRRAIAAAMSKSKREIPHYYLQINIDMTRPLQWLSAENQSRPITERVLPVAVYLKALALAIREVPDLNGYWIDDRLKINDQIHIGFGISMKGGGLVAPALLDVDKKTIAQIMADLTELIPRARTGPLRSSEMTQATITLTSLGDRGVSTVLGIIYPPQVALIGLGKITEQPWAENGTLSVRPVMTATLSADHRATDGSTGARFLNALDRFLQDPSAL